MARNDDKEYGITLDVRDIIDRIHKAIDTNKGIRLSAYEASLLGLTIFAEDPVISEKQD